MYKAYAREAVLTTVKTPKRRQRAAQPKRSRFAGWGPSGPSTMRLSTWNSKTINRFTNLRVFSLGCKRSNGDVRCDHESVGKRLHVCAGGHATLVTRDHFRANNTSIIAQTAKKITTTPVSICAGPRSSATPHDHRTLFQKAGSEVLPTDRSGTRTLDLLRVRQT